MHDSSTAYARLLDKLTAAGEAARLLGSPSHTHACPLVPMVRRLETDEFAILRKIVDAEDAAHHAPFRNVTLGTPDPPVKRLLSRFVGLVQPVPTPELGARSWARAQIEEGIRSSDREAFDALRVLVDTRV